MRKMKGSVLVQVLMTAVIVSIIAAGMMHLLLLRSTAIKRGQDSTAGTAKSTGGLDAIYAFWSLNGGVNCSSIPTGFSAYSGTGCSAGSSGAGTPSQCNCCYTNGTTIISATMTSSGGKAACGLVISSIPPL